MNAQLSHPSDPEPAHRLRPSDHHSPGAGRRPGAQVLRQVHRIELGDQGLRSRLKRDALATEEPLEIRVSRPGGGALPVSVTMRTPGADFELAAGFLYGEGLLGSEDEISTIRYCLGTAAHEQRYNVVTVDLADGVEMDIEGLQRNFYTTSSCGVCGKASIDAVLGPACSPVRAGLRVAPDVLLTLPTSLGEAQPVFARTGGLHAAATFSADGSLVDIREDVGRHNAMDKLVGSALLRGELPLASRLVLVSGRLSFELVQKAARAGVELLAGVSAPSSLAVQLADEAGLTLVGFLRERSFNVYTAPERVLMTGSPSNGTIEPEEPMRKSDTR